MCRLIEYVIDPVFAGDEEEGGATEEYSYEEEETPQETQQPARTLRNLEPSSFFPQDFINNSQMAFFIIKRQLMLLIHANYCCKIDTMFPDRASCELQSCEVFKRVLEHLKNCQVLQCDTPRCISSRNILRHYSTCYNINCRICF